MMPAGAGSGDREFRLMNSFTPSEEAACSRLVHWALEEDLDAAGDLTSLAVIPADQVGRAAFVARAPGVLAGLPTLSLLFAGLDPLVQVQLLRADGCVLQPGDHLVIVSGPLRPLLAGERTALNFLQRLSGVATRTRQFVEAVAGFPCRILDTRKTTPGWRLLEKYAVRCGGGTNHRMGLYDAILIKDNHLAALGSDLETVTRAVQAARQQAGHTVPLIIEVDRLDQLDRALACGPDIVLLDNMTPDTMHEAVNRRNARAPSVLLEASGGVRLDTVRAIAAVGVDRISVGALTHSAPALDIALDYEAP
jgi:nicotinate-nucleotide pyrophosphorylase (carboxylating)